MSQFSTNESVSLEKDISKVSDIVKTPSEKIDEVYEIGRCVQWIQENGFKKVCLQFPDHSLPDSTEVAVRLQSQLKQPVYVLGDTAYESCCIDYVAAAHVNADAVIHFGPTCFSQSVGAIPHINIYEKLPLELDTFYSCLQTFLTQESCIRGVTVLLDTGYYYLQDELKEKLQPLKCDVRQVGENIAEKNALEKIVFVGDDRKLFNIKFIYKSYIVYHYSTTPSPTISKVDDNNRISKRRYYLIEKIKDSNTVGIIIGTLAVKNYMKVIDRIKKLLLAHKKKYYIISVGKPTVAKLANFPEVDIYVLVTCSMNELYDNRDFYKPIATPYDVEMALNPNAESIDFSFDFNSYLAEDDISNLKIGETGDVSLLTGKVRCVQSEDKDGNDGSGDKIALKSSGTLALNTSHGAGYLSNRSWKGLEPNLGQTEVKKAEEGRKGIAASYENEES